MKVGLVNLTEFQTYMLERINNLARAFSACIEKTVSQDDVVDPFLTAVNIHIATHSGPCEIWLYPDGAEVSWGQRVARFEKDDYPHGGMEQAIIDCLALVFSGEAHRDPESFPTASGCMLVPTFPFIWSLGKVYRGFKEKRKRDK